MNNAKRIVLVTGGFDPLHSGHIEYFKAAKSLGDILIVGINSDEWLQKKKGKAFLPAYEREQIISNLSMVDNVITFDDSDGTAIEAIIKTKHFFKNSPIIFANGGDRTEENIPEMEYFKLDKWLSFEFAVGGSDKRNSSSWILENWIDNKTVRPWGYYKVLHELDTVVKVKELVVEPGKSLSLQKHQHRSEHWFITQGIATVYTLNTSTTDIEIRGVYKIFDQLHIPRYEWHMLSNENKEPLKIVEIQYGDSCDEDDIERKNTQK